MTLELDVVTLFPAHFDWVRDSRPVANAIAAGSLRLRVLDLRDHAPGRGTGRSTTRRTAAVPGW